MKRKVAMLIPIFMIAFMVILTAGAQEKEGTYTEIPSIKGIKPLDTGEPAPLFMIEDLDGNDFSLESYKNKNPVLLFFWSFFCGPCRDEIPLMNQITKEYKEKGLIVAAVNLDGKEMKKAISKFAEQENISYIIAFDELTGDAFKVADPYGVGGTPTLFLIDKSGTLTFNKIGSVSHEELKDAIEKVVK